MMETHLRPPNQLLAHIAESTFATVGVGFVTAVGRLVSTSWGVTGLFVSEAELEDPLRGRVLIAPVPEDRPAEWIAARGESWFPQGTKFYAPAEVSGTPVLERVIDGHSAKTILSIRLESRSTPHSEYVGIIDSEPWSPEQEASAEALLRMIAPRVAAELERERHARAAAIGDRVFRHVADPSEGAILVWSGRPPGTIEYVNHAALNLIGRTEAELRSDPSTLLTALVSLPRSEDVVQLTYEGELQVQRPDGVSVTVSARVLVADATAARPSTHYAVLRAVGEFERVALMPRAATVASQLAEGTRVAVMMVTDGGVTYMNRIAAQIFGTTNPDEIARRRVVVHSGGRDLPLSFADCVRQLARHRYGDRVIAIPGRRGIQRLFDVRTNNISVGGTTRLIVLLTDVSVREQRAAAVEAAYETHRLILNALPIALAAVAPEGTVLWINEQWKPADHGRVDELQSALALSEGANFMEACRRAVDAGLPGARELTLGLGSVLNGSLPSYATEYETAPTEEGRDTRSFVAFVTPLNGAGAIVGLAETTMVTRRERDAKDESFRIRAILENLPEQVARLRLNGDVLQVIGPGRRAPTVALLPNGQFKRNVRDVLPADEAQQLLEAVREASESNSLVVTMLHIMEQDRERQYEVHVMPLDGDVLLTLLDRTAEQRARRKLPGEGDEISPRLRRRNPYDLTFREASVLELMSNGASDKEIAAQLGVSVFTVNKHVSKILHKMGAVSRTEASIRAIRESLITR